MKILVTVDKFGEDARTLLENSVAGKHEVVYAMKDRILIKAEIIDWIVRVKPDIIIAGTEPYTKMILNVNPHLKVISRVGIGLDSVDLVECERLGIKVHNTPDAPSNAVAELTIGQMFNALRKIQDVDMEMRDERWVRYVGKDLTECTVGIVGCGRIGSLVAKKLFSLKPKTVYVNDINRNKYNTIAGFAVDVELETLLKFSDIITVHIPMNDDNKDFVNKEKLNLMKKDVILINTSRGGILNETDLYTWLVKNPKAKAVLDVFKIEPYVGQLLHLPNTYVTPHLGSCTEKARLKMEVGAVQNILVYL